MKIPQKIYHRETKSEGKTIPLTDEKVKILQN